MFRQAQQLGLVRILFSRNCLKKPSFFCLFRNTGYCQKLSFCYFKLHLGMRIYTECRENFESKEIPFLEEIGFLRYFRFS